MFHVLSPVLMTPRRWVWLTYQVTTLKTVAWLAGTDKNMIAYFCHTFLQSQLNLEQWLWDMSAKRCEWGNTSWSSLLPILQLDVRDRAVVICCCWMWYCCCHMNLAWKLFSGKSVGAKPSARVVLKKRFIQNIGCIWSHPTFRLGLPFPEYQSWVWTAWTGGWACLWHW